MSELSLGTLSGLAANSYVIDVASGSSLDLSAGAVFPAGSIIQVVSTTKTDVFSASVAARPTISGAVTGLSASITPSSATSKIMVLGSITGSGPSGLVNYHLFRDGSQSDYTGDVAGSRNVSASGRLSGGTPDQVAYSFQFLDTANSTATTTYDFRLSHASASTGTVYVNRSADDVNANNYSRSASSITLIEVAG